MSAADVLGTVGISLLLLAYVLDVTDKLSDDDPRFFALNFVGASLAAVASDLLPFWPFVVLEGTWAIVSAIALVRSLRRRAAAPSLGSSK